MNISVSITHYNNTSFFPDVIENIINDDRINEICITDDCSKLENWNLLKNKVQQITSNKIKLFRNTQNLGNFMNKLKGLSNCTNEWAILLDMDNIILPGYVDAIYKETQWNDKYIYAPIQARTFSTKNKYSDSHALQFYKVPKILNKKTIKPCLTATTFKTIQVECSLNVGNYFVNKKEFLRIENNTFGNYNKGRLSNVDYLQTNTEWLANNKEIKILENMKYAHRIHNNSCYKQSNKREGKRITLKCIRKLNSLK